MPFEVLQKTTTTTRSNPNKVLAKTRAYSRSPNPILQFFIGSKVADRLGLRKDDDVEISVGTGADAGKYLLRFSGGADPLRHSRPTRRMSDGRFKVTAGQIEKEIDDEVVFTVRSKCGDAQGPVLFLELGNPEGSGS